MYCAWTVHQSMVHKTSVKIGTGAPLLVLQKGKQFAEINWRQTAVNGSLLHTWAGPEQLGQPETLWLFLKRDFWWALQGENEMKTILILPWATHGRSYSFLKVTSLVCRISSGFPVFFLTSFSEALQLCPLQPDWLGYYISVESATLDIAFQK